MMQILKPNRDNLNTSLIIGTLFLTVCLGRLYYNHFTREHHFGFEAAAWY